MCYFWFVYFELMQESPFVQSRRRVRLASALVWVMAALLIVNIFTGVLFYVDDGGTYRRGPLFIVQYLLSYAYVLFTCLRALIGIFRRSNYARRRMLIMLALFPLAPAGAGIMQFIYPELPLACAALSLATLILYLEWIDMLIAVDPLTRLNNRKQLSHFYEQWQEDDDENEPPYLIIADANKFKSINDTYGHLQGDAALVRIANALRLACRETCRRSNITRYGGDEFVVLAWVKSEEDIKALCELINRHAAALNTQDAAPYDLSLCFGYARAEKNVGIDELIKAADERLYEMKRLLPEISRR